MPLQINLARLSVPLACSDLEHSSIDGRNIDVEVAAISGNRVIGQTIEFLEMFFLQNDEALAVPQALRIVVLAAGLLRDRSEE